MITLITGTPGSGKTAYAVKMLDELVSGDPRPVFVMGIPDLQIPHEVAPPLSEWTRREPSKEDPSVTEALFNFPDGALIIIDECQKVYRPRGTASKVPDHVEALEKHRHSGLDFWLITQSPKLIDMNVRQLVGKHIHLRSTWRGRKLYEWPEATSTESTTALSQAATRPYRLPKSIYGKYKSASLHVKQTRRLPLSVFVLVACLVGLVWLGSHIVDRVGGAIAGEAATQPTPQERQPVARTIQAATGVVTDPFTAARASSAAGTSVEDYMPRLPQRPETAPLYDGIRTVRSMPTVAGCVAMRGTCRCFTSQATDAFLTDAQCRAWLASPPFDPWRDPARDERSEAKPGSAEGLPSS